MKLKVIRIFAIVLLVFTSVNIAMMFFFGLGAFSDTFKRSNFSFSREPVKSDTMYLHKQRMDRYSWQLDSLIEVNPLQAELFADKLSKKYKNETFFIEYKALAVFKQDKFEEALQLYKEIENPYSEFVGTKRNDNRNIALCFKKLKQYDSAVHYFKISSIDDNLYNLADCFILMKEKDSALFYFRKKLEGIKKSNNKIYQIKEMDFLRYKIDSLKKASH